MFFNTMSEIHFLYLSTNDMWVPVTTARRVLRLPIDKWLQICRVDVNILNKQLWTADKGWSSSLRVVPDANDALP